VKTVVVKFGSSTVTGPRGRLRRSVLAARAAEIAALAGAGQHVVVVSSGAIACGQAVLGLGERPRPISAQQAAAAGGEGRQFAAWSRALLRHGLVAAQVLLTSTDMAERTSYVNARQTLRRLLRWGAVPVVNENDTTATDEISFGDNDVLAAQVAIMLRADLLLLLTDRGGLYTSDPLRDPGASLIEELRSGEEVARAAFHGSSGGAGGMRGKVAAALMAAAADVPVVIADGSAASVIGRAAGGETVGTRVRPRSGGEPAFKLWLRYAKPVHGTVQVDEGAARALRRAGASLLPVGVLDVHGTFSAGDAVLLRDPAGGEIGRGVAAMSAREVRRVAGLRSDEVRRLLPNAGDEVVHRDRLVLTGEEDV
jgi:glutamate 5-kinase